LEAFWSPNWRPLTDRILVSEAFRIGVDQNYCPSADGCPSGSPTFNSPTFRRPNILPWRMVRAPWEVTRVGTHRTDAPDQADLAPAPGCADGPQGLRCGDFVYLLQNGVPTNVLDVDTSMFGFRFGGQTFAGLDFTLNYIFKKSEVPGTALRVSDLFDPARPSDENGNMNNFRTGAEADDAIGPDDHYSLARAAADLATPDNDGNGVPDGQDRAVARCIYDQRPTIILKGMHGPHYNFDDQTNTAYETVNGATGCEMVGFWYPWTHIIGGTLTYNDFDYTGFIWRVEQSYSTKEPRNGAPPLAGPRAGNFPATRDFESHGKRTTGAWRSMIGFDYLRTIYPKPPPWIRSRKWLSTWLTDQWFFTFQFFNEYYPHVDGQIGLLDSVTDRMQHYNPVLTYVMTGFFMNQKLRPFWAYGYDVNAQTHVAWLQMQYFLTNKFAIRFGDIMYMGSKDAESFLFLHKYADRDNLFVRLEYYLL
jgi:hypothetical protein